MEDEWPTPAAAVRRQTRPVYVAPPSRTQRPLPQPAADVGKISDGVKRLDLSGSEGDVSKYDEIPVEVTGNDVPAPVQTGMGFEAAGLGSHVACNVARCGYARPTPVQRYALPILLAGRDLMACAQTGSGKTAAFCLPIVSGVLSSGGGGDGGRGRVAMPAALVLAPTRELAGQIHEEAKKFSYQTGVKVVVAYGGTPMFNQLRDLEKGVDILVATPGRLVDLIERGKVSLKIVKYLAMDEADRMLDMGFEPSIRKIIERMDMPLKSVRQTMLFSATFPPEIQRLASDFLSNYIFLTVGKVGSSTDLICQRVEYVQGMEKRRRLLDLLHVVQMGAAHGKQALSLVFVETKRQADSLERWLSVNGYPATSIHGDRTQREREDALTSFKTGVTPILVATDVAARGLDVPNVAHVINFDLPRSISDYVHRIGRTGRAGKSGLATALFTEDNQPLAKDLMEVLHGANQKVPDWLQKLAQNSSSYGGSSGRGYRSGGGRFGNRDFRRSSSSWGDNRRGGFYDGSTDFYPSHGYSLGTEQIGASGWD